MDTRYGPPRRLGTLIGGTAPGTNVMTFPKGTALRIRAGTVLTFQMHYTAHGHELKDRTSVGFRFAPEAPDEEMRMSAFINGSFTLPAGAKDVAVATELEPTEPVLIWGLLPHTHLRGTRWKYTLEKPDGSSQVVLDEQPDQVGVGGVHDANSALQLLMAGASAVQVGTANFADPRATIRVLDELASWCDSHGVATIAELIGAAHP